MELDLDLTCFFFVLYHWSNEIGEFLNHLEKSNRRLPLSFPARKHVEQQISAVSERGAAKLRLSVHKGRLKWKFVAQKDIKFVFIYRRVCADRLFIYFELFKSLLRLYLTLKTMPSAVVSLVTLKSLFKFLSCSYSFSSRSGFCPF